MRRVITVLGAAALILAGAAPSGSGGEERPRPTLYVTATAHLDTQWRWTIRDTIEKFIPDTLRGNFALFEKYPGYTFSFEGAFRYMLAKEYYPEEYRRLGEYVRQGRWKVAGSWVDAVDTNIPAPESLFRQALYGNGFFFRDFGRRSRDVNLPDCFGFGFALPSIATASGLAAFSTQKLTWGSSVGVPFDVGLWEGVDGSRLLAALNPGDYVTRLTTDLSSDPKVREAVDRVATGGGPPVDLKYFGVGDQGGAPRDASVEWLEKSLAGGGPVKVKSASPDQMALDLAGLSGSAGEGKLPLYRGELLMTRHGAGCYTSQAAMKRYNRKNERLADAAERAAVAADWLGGSPYPVEALREAWVRFLWHQFHDDLTGTSIPEAYEFSWNDETIARNQLSGILSDSAGAVARALDTRGKGVPLVVYNPLSIAREDPVEADVSFGPAAPASVRVFGPDGKEVPAQVESSGGKRARIVFSAAVPPLGFAVFEVRPGGGGAVPGTGLSVRDRTLENGRYRVELSASGDVASIRDKREGRELLKAPLQLQLLKDAPSRWPAWEVEYGDLSAPPRTVVGGPARIRVAERGPARVALEVTREADGSSFVQTVRLAAGGAMDRVEIATEIDWRTRGTLLKAAFPLATGADKATYDLGLGTIQRGVNTPKLYEVPAQQWADLTGPDGSFGVAILNDSKYGWDHPDPSTLRLSLIHTPAVGESWKWVGDQFSMDLGHHRVLYALASHRGDWREGRVVWLADRLNQPLRAWQAKAHPGALGRVFSLAHVLSPGRMDLPPVAVRAFKKGEAGEEYVVRMQEIGGRDVKEARLVTARPVTEFREINAAEEPLPASDPRARRPARIEEGALVASFAPYQPRTFALKLGNPPARLEPPAAAPVPLDYDLDGISLHGGTDGDFDGQGHAIAGELLPGTITTAGISFRTGPVEPGRKNLMRCRGQKLPLPAGDWNRLYLLAAATGDREADLEVGGRKVALWIQDWAEPIGQWDNRLNAGVRHDDPAEIVPAFVKPARLGWLGTHRHGPGGLDEAYAFTEAFLYRVDLPRGTREVGLPDEPEVRILAASVAKNDNDALQPAQPIMEAPARAAVRIRAAGTLFVDPLRVDISSPNPHARVRYTLDGSDPGPASPEVKGPLTLRDTATVKARAFAPGLDDRFVAESRFQRLDPVPAAAPRETSPGLRCAYFEGSWKEMPDPATLKAAREEVVPAVSLPSFARTEDILLVLNGYLRVPADGLYLLSLRADDTVALDLDGKTIIDPAASNGSGDDRREVALRTGLHPLAVRYLHRKGDGWLDLWIGGPGFPLRAARGGDFAH